MRVRNNINTGVTTLIVGAFLMSCSSYRVISDIDNTEDFSAFKTYQYEQWADNANVSRLDRERVESAFAAEASARGLEQVESGGDILVGLYFIGELRRQQTAQTTTMGMGSAGMGRRGMRGPGWGWGAANSTTVVNETTYVDGSLGIEVFDVADKKLIWHAVGSGKVIEDPQKRSRAIPTRVKAIMKKYPVAPAK